jgi:hypothetical protein
MANPAGTSDPPCYRNETNMTRDDHPELDPLAEDVAAASAAYLWGVLPEILKTAPEEAVRRLAQHFETAIRAYLDGRENWDFLPDE